MIQESNYEKIIEQALQKLVDLVNLEKRIFCSEADFQFALAWKIKELLPTELDDIRLEFPWQFNTTEKRHIDIIVIIEKLKKIIPIELKYKTKKIGRRKTPSLPVYDLLENHGAHPQGRYDFLRDIKRMEECLGTEHYIDAKDKKYSVDVAFAIFLTNDPLYWRNPNSNSKIIDRDFRIHETEKEEKVGGRELRWSKTNNGTTKGREDSIKLSGKYPLNWSPQKNYEVKVNPFRYLVIRIPPID